MLNKSRRRRPRERAPLIIRARVPVWVKRGVNRLCNRKHWTFRTLLIRALAELQRHPEVIQRIRAVPVPGPYDESVSIWVSDEARARLRQIAGSDTQAVRQLLACVVTEEQPVEPRRRSLAHRIRESQHAMLQVRPRGGPGAIDRASSPSQALPPAAPVPPRPLARASSIPLPDRLAVQRQGENLTSISTRVPFSVRDRLNRLCESKRMDLQGLVRVLLDLTQEDPSMLSEIRAVPVPKPEEVTVTIALSEDDLALLSRTAPRTAQALAQALSFLLISLHPPERRAGSRPRN